MVLNDVVMPYAWYNVQETNRHSKLEVVENSGTPFQVSLDVGSYHALQGGVGSAQLDKKDKRGRVQAFRVHIGAHGLEDGTPLRGEGWWPLWDSVS